MFTRMPTFIPTVSLESSNEQPTKDEKKAAYDGIGQARRKRTKATRKRIAAKQVDESRCGELPVISDRHGRTRGNTLQTPSHRHKLRNNKLFESRIASPYTTPSQKAKIISELNRKAGKLPGYWEPKEDGAIAGMETELPCEERDDVLTHPTMHTRNRRKLNDDIHNMLVNKQAKKWMHNRGDNNNDNTSSRALGSRVVSRNDSTTDTESLMKTPLLADIRPLSRTPNTHDHETSKNFKSKIPIRFPEIHENKRFAESRMKHSHNQLTTPLPPIANENGCKLSSDSTGNVTKSIMDYQSIVKQDFQRLGEDLENTFKLLQQYIKCNANEHTNSCEKKY